MPKRDWRPLLAAALALAAFLPALRNDWATNWDDGIYLLSNLAWRGFGTAELRWMWTAFFSGHYHPLTWMSYALDYSVWGLRPFGFHLTNLLLHAANAGLFFFVARRLLAAGGAGAAAPAGAFWAAVFFAVHPLRTESVAWAAERRDLLSGLFLLLSLLAYLRRCAGEGRPRLWLAASLLAYALSLLSKAIGVSLPAVLLLLDWYPLRRPLRRVWLEKLPYAALAVAAALVGLAAQYSGRSLWGWHQHGLAQRLAQGAYSAAFYLAKTVWPANLSPLYELRVPFDPAQPRFLLAAAAAILATWLAWRLRRSRPWWLATWLCYLATLTPVCGVLAQYGPQLVADRYSYLACLGPAVLLGAAAARSRARWAAALAAGLAVLSWRQTGYWRDADALWNRVLAVAPDSAIAHNNLGVLLSRRGELEGARRHFTRALELNGACIEARRALAAGSRDPRLRREIEINPICRNAALNLAANQAARGELAGAISVLREIVATEPGNAKAAANLERALALRHRSPAPDQSGTRKQAALKPAPTR
ncbi:MAG: tetratricopeptide repeat protein [Elusimicrobia bacterium]|nr:tetratricopeptide repeat protein [Elusimicrobiota bacterium]